MNEVAVCSWSLLPESPEDLASKVRACGLNAVQLALDPIRTGAWSREATASALRRAGVNIVSGMMAMAGEDYTTIESIRRTGGLTPTATWDANLAAAGENASLARALGISLVTFHAGHLPEDEAQRRLMLERVGAVATEFARRGISVALETGQERVGTLLAMLESLTSRDVGVNFDAANMILYGSGDPVAAFRTLAPFVQQAHVKDATPPKAPGEWGADVPVGEGVVDWAALLREIAVRTPKAQLVIEREAGAARVEDVRTAAALVRRLTPPERSS